MNTNLKKLYLLRSKALVLSLLCSSCLLSGCGKKVECDISEDHTHVYVNEEGYKRNIDSEKLRIDGYDRTDEYDYYEDDDLVKYITKKDLLTIEDNIELINEIQKNNTDFIEYRYSYTTFIPIIHHSGKITYTTLIPTTHYSWTTDSNRSRLTGETRVCHHVYVAYKIEKDEKGKYVLIPSNQVDDINTVKGEYPYIKKEYYKIINLKDKKIADYEDGPAEEDPHYKEEKDNELTLTK